MTSVRSSHTALIIGSALALHVAGVARLAAEGIPLAGAPADFWVADTAPPPTPAADIAVYDESGERVAANGWSESSLRPRVRLKSITLGVAYDDNIFISPDGKEGDTVFTVGTGLGLVWGDPSWRSVSIDYSISGHAYLDHSDENGVDQNASASTSWNFGRLAVTTSHSFNSLTGSDREVGTLTDRWLMNNSLNATYDLSGKARLTLGAGYRFSIFDEYFDQNEWDVRFGVDYELLPKMRVGFNAGYGQLEADSSPSQEYWQANGTISYAATGKLSLNSSAGVQWRDYGSGGVGSNEDFVFSFGANYMIVTGTNLTLDGHRRIVGSAAEARNNITATGVNLGLTHQLTGKLSLGFNGGYEWNDYSATVEGAPSGRSDEYWFIGATAAYSLSTRLSLSVFYNHGDNASNRGEVSYDSNRYGANLTLSF